MKKLFALLIVVGLALAVLVLWTAFKENALSAIASTKTEWIPLILLLFSLSFALKAFRWQGLLKSVDSTASFRNALVSWSSAYFLSYFTPGRVLEPLRALVYKQLAKTPFSLTAPLVIIERIADLGFFFLVFLVWALLSKTITGSFLFFGLLAGIVAAALLAVRFRKRMLDWAMQLLEGMPFLRGKKTGIRKVFLNLRQAVHSIGFRQWTQFCLLTLAAWLLEAIIIVVIVQSNNTSITVPAALVAISVSAIAALISSIPAGIGILEASLSGLLVLFGLPLPLALGTAILYRAYSILFVLVAGIVYFLGLRKKGLND